MQDKSLSYLQFQKTKRLEIRMKKVAHYFSQLRIKTFQAFWIPFQPLSHLDSVSSRDCIYSIIPKGERCLILSQNARTSAIFTERIWDFKSLLPGGSPVSHSTKMTLVEAYYDCDAFYILDVLFWKGSCYKDYDAEFRFYWIESHIMDLHSDSISSWNSYRMMPMKRCCRLEEAWTHWQDKETQGLVIQEKHSCLSSNRWLLVK